MPYEIVDTITYDAAAKDLSVEVAKAKATKAEMLMPVCRLNDAKLIVQEMVKQRWEPMGIESRHARHVRAGLHQDAWASTASTRCRSSPWLNPKSSMTKVLEKHHTAKFPSDQIDIDAGFTFEALLIAAQAWLAAKSTKPDALMEALRKTKIDQHVMVGGPIEFDAKGQNVNIKGTALSEPKRKPTVVLPLELGRRAAGLPDAGLERQAPDLSFCRPERMTSTSSFARRRPSARAC